MLRGLMVAFTAGALIGFGCGGDGSSDSSPQGKCNSLVTTVCKKEASCDKTLTADDEKACEMDGMTDCAHAGMVSPTIDQCAHDIQGLSCASITPKFTPPGSCEDAIITVEDQKCRDLSKALCTRISECTKAATVDECLPAVIDTLDCVDVVQIGPNYDSCVSMLKSATCDALFPGGKLALPMACQGVLGGPGGGSTGGAGGAGGSRGGAIGGAGGAKI
jgi:hypothetical protein